MECVPRTFSPIRANIRIAFPHNEWIQYLVSARGWGGATLTARRIRAHTDLTRRSTTAATTCVLARSLARVCEQIQIMYLENTTYQAHGGQHQHIGNSDCPDQTQWIFCGVLVGLVIGIAFLWTINCFNLPASVPQVETSVSH